MKELLDRIQMSMGGFPFVWTNYSTLSLLGSKIGSKNSAEFILKIQQDVVHVFLRKNDIEAKLFDSLHVWDAMERVEELIAKDAILKQEFFPFINNLYTKDATEAQVKCLQSFGISPGNINRGHALLAIRVLITLGLQKGSNDKNDEITQAQAFFLAKHGISLEGLDKKGATKIISNLKEVEQRAIIDSTVALG